MKTPQTRLRHSPHGKAGVRVLAAIVLGTVVACGPTGNSPASTHQVSAALAVSVAKSQLAPQGIHVTCSATRWETARLVTAAQAGTWVGLPTKAAQQGVPDFWYVVAVGGFSAPVRESDDAPISNSIGFFIASTTGEFWSFQSPAPPQLGGDLAIPSVCPAA